LAFSDNLSLSGTRQRAADIALMTNGPSRRWDGAPLHSHRREAQGVGRLSLPRPLPPKQGRNTWYRAPAGGRRSVRLENDAVVDCFRGCRSRSCRSGRKRRDLKAFAERSVSILSTANFQNSWLLSLQAFILWNQSVGWQIPLCPRRESLYKFRYSGADRQKRRIRDSNW
jgi:hypothetical protein